MWRWRPTQWVMLGLQGELQNGSVRYYEAGYFQDFSGPKTFELSLWRILTGTQRAFLIGKYIL
jgi:hypothetical protein